MSRKVHTPAQKAAALERLKANGGDIASTEIQTGIPQRTLYRWRQEIWLEQLQHIRQTQPDRPPLTDLTGAPPIAEEVLSEDDNLQILNRIRQRLITEIADMTSEGLILASPHQRIQALTMLLDRLMKLEEHLRPYLPVEPSIRRIEYVYPDGSKHQVPPWYDGNDDADEYRRAYYGD